MSTTAGGSAKRTTVVLGTATPGGGFPVYGAAVADTVHETEPTLEIEQRNTKGSTENVPLLESGQVDIALVQGEVAHEAFNGIGRSPANLKIVAAMYSTPGMFVVRADSPHRRVEDLRGQPVVFGARGSGLVILSKYVLDGITKWRPGWQRNGWKTASRQPVKNTDLWQRLVAAMAPHQVRWTWVKGHAGDPGNERADELARLGISEATRR